MHWNGFSACMTIEGHVVQEHATTVSADKKTITCWVASEVGKHFVVHWKNDLYRHFDTSGYITMDGHECGGAVLSSQILPNSTARAGISDGMTLHPFKFGSLELSDEESLLSQPENPDFGLIRLQIAPIAHYAAAPFTPAGTLPKIKMHEESKLHGAHRVELGEGQKLPKYTPRVVVWPAGPELVTFCFKYRSLAFLLESGIISSRDPSTAITGPHIHSPKPQIPHLAPPRLLVPSIPPHQPYKIIPPFPLHLPGPGPSLSRKRKAPGGETSVFRMAKLGPEDEDLADLQQMNVLRDQLNRLEAKVSSKKSYKKQKISGREPDNDISGLAANVQAKLDTFPPRTSTALTVNTISTTTTPNSDEHTQSSA